MAQADYAVTLRPGETLQGTVYFQGGQVGKAWRMYVDGANQPSRTFTDRAALDNVAPPTSSNGPVRVGEPLFFEHVNGTRNVVTVRFALFYWNGAVPTALQVEVRESTALYPNWNGRIAYVRGERDEAQEFSILFVAVH